MKIGMTSLTLRQHSVENVIKCAKKAGLDGIEWGESESHMPLCDKERAHLIKTLSKQYGVEIFSYGSYCRMIDKEVCDKTLETAVMLSAPIIRVWAGNHPPDDITEECYDNIIECTRYMAKKAQKYGIKIGFEYHKGTLTQEPDSAAELIKRIDMENVGLYWQPFGELGAQTNFNSFKAVRPYIAGNLHVHNYSEKNGYQPLENIAEDLKLYYSDIKECDCNLLIEFVCNGEVESLMNDARLLRSIFK